MNACTAISTQFFTFIYKIKTDTFFHTVFCFDSQLFLLSERIVITFVNKKTAFFTKNKKHLAIA